MASANSPSLSSNAPAPSVIERYAHWNRAGAIAFPALAVAAAAPTLAARTETALLVVVLCVAWHSHLGSSTLPWFWNWPLTLLLGAQLIRTLLQGNPVPFSSALGAIASGAIVYLMFWALLTRRRSGLQSLATMAFLLAFALFGRPSILICALFLSLAFVVAGYKKLGGFSETAVLIFTPAALCLLLTVVLRKLEIVLIQIPILNMDLPQLSSWRYHSLQGGRLQVLFPVLLFALATILARIFEHKSRPADLAKYGLMLGMLGGILLRPIAGPVVALDLTLIAYGGAMCLAAADPPRRFLPRLFLLLSAAAALVIQIK
jgi:hypothetical protein